MTAVFLVALFSEFPIIRVAEEDTLLAGITHKLCNEFLLSLRTHLAHPNSAQLSLLYLERDAAPTPRQ